jgi:hypothetical protein
MRRSTLAAATLTLVAATALTAGSSSFTLATKAEPAAAVSATASVSGGTGIEALAIRSAKAAAVVSKPVPITYHNGPVLTAATNVYFVWYGNWGANAAGQTVLSDFTKALGGSAYFGINTTYTDALKVPVTYALTLAGTTNDAYSQGTVLTDIGVRNVVSNAIALNRLPKDANGIYVVLSSADVKESSGFVTKYCGWHAHAVIATTDIKFAFVGDPTTQGLANCSTQPKLSPNAVPGADAMVSVLAHEIEEAVTDPDLNAWYDAAGSENADKCAWTYGTTYKTTNGALANMKLGTRDYLVQQNWKIAATQACSLS